MNEAAGGEEEEGDDDSDNDDDDVKAARAALEAMDGDESEGELPAALRMDEYDDDEAVGALVDMGIEEEGEGMGLADDELEGLEEGGDPDLEDHVIKPDDAVLLVANTEEDEYSSLEVHVYDQENGNLYVHHDVSLPSLPLCLAWMDTCPLGSKASQLGSYCAVGTFEPAIEIWNLDVLDALEPTVVLGGKVEEENGKKKKKKKGQASVKYSIAVLGLKGLLALIKPLYLAGSHTDAVISLSWNRTHRQVLASGGGDCVAKLWDITTQQCETTLTHHTDKVQSVLWHQTEATVLATASFDKHVALLDARSPDSVSKFALEADPEGLEWDCHAPAQLLIATEDGLITCRDLRMEKEPIYSFLAHEKGCGGLSVSPHAAGMLATCSDDKTVKIWDTLGMSGAVAAEPIACKAMAVGRLFGVKWYPGTPFLLASGGSKGHLALWHADEEDAVRAKFGGRAEAGAHGVLGEDGSGAEAEAEAEAEGNETAAGAEGPEHEVLKKKKKKKKAKKKG
ncbi:unnamed protein product [Chrysoparadoxa australica]